MNRPSTDYRHKLALSVTSDALVWAVVIFGIIIGAALSVL